MNRITCTTRLFAAVLSLSIGAAAAASQADATAAEAAPVNAVWLQHESTFTYMGRTTYYSCDGLRAKVRYLMKQVGARPDDLKVRVSCGESRYSGLDPMPTVRIKASLPAIATPELLEKLRTDPRRELVTRVQGKGGQVDHATAQFPAQWRMVELDGRRGRPIEEGDCELLEYMVRDVFVPMGIKEAEGSRLGCVPHQTPLGSVEVKLETLQKAVEPDAPART